MSDQIVHGLSFDDYCRADGWSHRLGAGTLAHGCDSMLALKAAMDGLLWKDSPALSFGRACHARMLEPDLYRDQYAVMPDFEPSDDKAKTAGWRNTKDYKAQRDAWLAEREGIETISQDEADQIDAMAAVMFAHPVVKLLRARGGCEVSVRYDLMGVPMKSRLDKHVPEGQFPPTIIDLKTTTTTDRDALDRAVLSFRYHFKAAVYIDGLEAATGERADYMWVFQEKQPPYDVIVRQIDDDSLRVGRQEYRTVLQRLKLALKANEWPGRSRDIERGGLPVWYLKRLEKMGGLS